MEDETVTDAEFAEAWGELSQYAEARMKGQPLTMAAGDDGQPVVGGALKKVLIGLGLIHLIRK